MEGTSHSHPSCLTQLFLPQHVPPKRDANTAGGREEEAEEGGGFKEPEQAGDCQKKRPSRMEDFQWELKREKEGEEGK